MPANTFFNLPEEKRQRIVNEAIDEFAAHPYHRASLSRIVERAGIAKGSMYQYFKDKFDLYLYLLEQGAQLKLKFIRDSLARLGEGADIFDMLIAASEAGFHLAELHPKLQAISHHLLLEPDKQFRERVLAHFGPAGEELTERWFQHAIDRGQIDRRIRPSTARYMVTALAMSIGQDMVAGRLSAGEALSFLREVFDVLEHGMRPRSGQDGE